MSVVDVNKAEALRRAVDGYADAMRAAFRDRLPPAIPHVALEVQGDLIRITPHSQRLLHRAHLHRLVEAGWDDAQQEGPPEPRAEAVAPFLTPISVAACTACAGKCCRHGGVQAYVSHDTLRQFRHDRPAASADDFVAAYADRLDARSYEGSCVHHAERGCTLPRERRSEVCNTHFCDGLLHIHAQRTAAGPSFSCLVIRLTDGQIHSCIWLSDRGFEVLDGPPDCADRPRPQAVPPPAG